ncbi:LCP family protein [Streptomyces vietnamensis]|uniref:LytR family transcriptional regulator n=1 Tax=Streptomyces vietnamensis TaxID=362257 RepID=A0A0B5HTW5_9ACTN|nr:LCP family protein [Streptomyces vietnamensis]AJF65500.1 LytR family transcriptional regulator [Streptomyces vietnamensis]
MDAHSRGQADEIDPADQWVLNPRTGNYELRLDRSAGQSQPRSQAQAQTPSRPRRSAPAPAPAPSPADAPVPGQRRRRAPEEPGSGQVPPQSRRKRKQGTNRKKKVLLWTGGTMAFVLVGGAAGAYAIYNKLDGNIGTVDVGDAAEATPGMDGPLNILIIGNDVRTGAGNESYGNKSNVTGHADTTLLMHVSDDRTNATVLSIPRDLKLQIPDCPTKQPDGSTKVIPGSVEKARFNESFGVNGRDPGCVMRTVKEMTGVGINHFMMVDFNAVKTLSAAVGGVKVCLNRPIKDSYSKLDLPAGESRIQGEAALSFLRNRHGLGNQSDLDRIKMQQQFVASMMRQLKEDTLNSPTQLLSVANAATEALTVDKGIGSALKLTSLAKEIGKVDLKNISFMTVPVVDNPDEPPNKRATVVPDPVEAPQVFSMIQNDVSFTEVKRKKQDAKNAQAQAQAKLLQGPRAAAVDVRVDVYNGSGVRGAAQSTINWLQNDQGVTRSTNKSNAPEKAAKTTLTYAPNQADQARKLADMMGLPASALKPGTQDAAAREPMTLVLGADFKGAGVPITGPTKAPDVEKVEADKKVCGG